MLLPVNQLVDIISSDELNVRNEEQVYQSVLQWVQYNVQERRVHLANVRSLKKNVHLKSTVYLVSLNIFSVIRMKCHV